MFYSILQNRDRDQSIQDGHDAELEAARREADSFSFGRRHKFTNTRLGAPMTTDIKERLRVKAAQMEKIDFDICAKLYREAADYIQQLEGRLSAQAVVKTEQPSLSDAEIDGQIVHFAKLYAWGLSCGQFDALREYTHQVTRALTTQRQDSAQSGINPKS